MTSRRTFLKSSVLALFLAASGRALSLVRAKRLVRPPGAVEEDVFLGRCVRCGACVAACAERGRGTLEPSGLLEGFLQLGTPRVNPLRAPCEAVLGKCEGVLPCVSSCWTGALRMIPTGEVKMGSVVWAREDCIQFLRGGCLVCDEVCPVSGAIESVEFEGFPDQGGRRLLPVFNPEKCVGCGRCVTACPAIPRALELTPIMERRTK